MIGIRGGCRYFGMREFKSFKSYEIWLLVISLLEDKDLYESIDYRHLRENTLSDPNNPYFLCWMYLWFTFLLISSLFWYFLLYYSTDTNLISFEFSVLKFYSKGIIGQNLVIFYLLPPYFFYTCDLLISVKSSSPSYFLPDKDNFLNWSSFIAPFTIPHTNFIEDGAFTR